MFAVYNICQETRRLVDTLAESDSSIGIKMWPEVSNLLLQEDDNSAKLLWLKEVVDWDFENSLNLFSSEEALFYTKLSLLFQMETRHQCDPKCSASTWRRTTSIDIMNMNAQEFEERMKGRHTLQQCYRCGKETKEEYRFINNEPLPFIAYSVRTDTPNSTKVFNLGEYQTICGVQYKVFAYSMYSPTRNHFYVHFRRGRSRYLYDGLRARTSNVLRNVGSWSDDPVNIVCLILSRSDS